MLESVCAVGLGCTGNTKIVGIRIYLSEKCENFCSDDVGLDFFAYIDGCAIAAILDFLSHMDKLIFSLSSLAYLYNRMSPDGAN